MTWVQTYSKATSRPCDRPAPEATLRASVSSTEDGVSDSDLGREGWDLKQEEEGAQSAGLVSSVLPSDKGQGAEEEGQGTAPPPAMPRLSVSSSIPWDPARPWAGQRGGIRVPRRGTPSVSLWSPGLPSKQPGPCGPAWLGRGWPQA